MAAHKARFCRIVVRPSRLHRGRRDSCTTKDSTLLGSFLIIISLIFIFGGSSDRFTQKEPAISELILTLGLTLKP